MPFSLRDHALPYVNMKDAKREKEREREADGQEERLHRASSSAERCVLVTLLDSEGSMITEETILSMKSVRQ